MSYEATIRVELDADTAAEARSALAGPLDDLFSQPEVLTLECSKATWVPVSGRREANPAA